MRAIRLQSSLLLCPVTGLNFGRLSEFSASTRPHCHDFAEFFAVTEGAIGHSLNGVREVLSAGTLVLLEPDDAHFYFRVEGRNCVLYNLAFWTSIYEETLTFLGLRGRPWRQTLHLSAGETAALAARLNEAGDLLSKDPLYAAASFRALIAETLCRSRAPDFFQSADRLPEWLERLVEEARKPKYHKEGAAAIKRLARRSYEHVCRSFQLYLGQTPTEFVNVLRLERAATLLATTDAKIHVIADTVGFDNLSHFYHLFKERFALSPARYRKKVSREIVPSR